ncbi:hypothetical protein [Halovivax cerinus]|uniref:Uncharacterized protein n=1 Tax=Halovivax cerinus TaxID=1487865 RepID=A0ABD5NJG4_9EURY|nr:hypothetical protein [Halovivax cerinus]
MPSQETRFDRRSLLRRVSGVTALGTSLGLAGCLSSLPTMGQRITYADVDVPAPGEPVYREWIPAPLETDEYEWDELIDLYLTPPTLTDGQVDARSLLHLQDRVIRPRVAYVGVGFENYERTFTIGPVTVALGAFDPADVHETVLGMGYERLESDRYDLFGRTDTGGVLCVLDGAIVSGRDPDSRPAVEAVADAGTGRRNRLHEVDDGFDAISSTVGSQPGIMFVTDVGEMHVLGLDGADVQKAAAATTFDDEYVYYQYVQTFAEKIDLTERRVRDRIEHEDETLDASQVDVVIRGNLATISMKHAIDDLSVDTPETVSPPQISWWFDHDPDDETLTIDHRGGETVDADELVVGYGSGANIREPFDRQFSSVTGTVAPGDSITVDVSGRGDRDRVSLVFHPGNRRSRVRIGVYRLDTP